MAFADIKADARNNALAAQFTTQMAALRALASSLTSNSITVEIAVDKVRKLSELYASISTVWTALGAVRTQGEINAVNAVGVDVDDLRIALSDALIPLTLAQSLTFGYTPGATRVQKLAGIAAGLPATSFAIPASVISAATDVVVAIDGLSLPV